MQRKVMGFVVEVENFFLERTRKESLGVDKVEITHDELFCSLPCLQRTVLRYSLLYELRKRENDDLCSRVTKRFHEASI